MVRFDWRQWKLAAKVRAKLQVQKSNPDLGQARGIRRLAWRQYPLAVKLTIVITAMILISVVAVSALSVYREQRSFRSELEQQAEVVLNTLNAAGADSLFNLRATALQQLMQGMGANRVVVSGRFYDSEGRVLADAHDDSARFALASDPFGQRLVQSDTTIFEWQPDRLLAGKAVIAGRQRLGAISVELSSVPLEAKLVAVRNQGLGVAVVAILAGAVVSLLVSRSITGPLGELTEVSTRMAKGDLTGQVHVRSGDEVAVLGGAFNKMVASLKAHIAEIGEKNKALQIATARAKEAARVKGEFLANVSHELRTPLNAIIGFSDMLLLGMSGPLTDKQTHKLTRLKENGTRLLTLINDLLDLTRIEAGRLEMVQKPFEPRALIQQVESQMESLAHQTKLEFRTDISPDVPQTLLGDEKRLQQVVVNLVANAFKFTQEGYILLGVQANSQEKTWSITVSDTGIGIPPHAVNLIFEEFRQLDGSYTRAYKGSGLGLAITRNLVRMMDGKITVKSTLGEGSTFVVTLPLAQPEELGEAVMTKVAPA